MFQTALQVRECDEIGRTPPVPASTSVNPWIPCFHARLPVAMLVHSIGESGGWIVASRPQTPALDQAREIRHVTAVQ